MAESVEIVAHAPDSGVPFARAAGEHAGALIRRIG
jgi:hypothetical protein